MTEAVWEYLKDRGFGSGGVVSPRHGTHITMMEEGGKFSDSEE